MTAALWLQPLRAAIERREAVILATVLDTQGSVPRAAGTRMLITAHGSYGTIGGGNLEFQCIMHAQNRLTGQTGKQADTVWRRGVHRFPLGARLGQCCGGVVTVLLEYIDPADVSSTAWIPALQTRIDQQHTSVLVTPLQDTGEKCVLAAAPDSRFQAIQTTQGADGVDYLLEVCRPPALQIMLFGAGHVGRALVKVLADVDCGIRWVDSRADQFPAEIPANTRRIIQDHPEDEVANAAARTCFVVMTHSHQLDQVLCETILKRTDFLYCGLIGSATKRRKFEQRMQAKGFTPDWLGRLTCPIGVPGINGKEPAVIAVAVAAQLLAFFQ